MLPIFQVIRFPVSIMYLFYHEKKSRRFFIFDIFRMMAAQVQIEMVLAIQGKLQLNPNYYIGQKLCHMWSFLVKNAPQKVEPKMAPVPVDLASAVFVCN